MTEDETNYMRGKWRCSCGQLNSIERDNVCWRCSEASQPKANVITLPVIRVERY